MARSSRKSTPPSKEANEASKPERLELTKQQAAQVKDAQSVFDQAQQFQQMVFNGILAAAGVDQARVVGGSTLEDDQHVLIVRDRKAAKKQD